MSTTLFDDHAIATMPALQPLAKRSAHVTLYRKLMEEGLDEGSATAVSRAVVDPADARRRLDRLVPVRVPGGQFLALDTHVWAPALTPYAVNNREASARRFPAGGAPSADESNRFRPLRPPTDTPEDSASLLLRAESPEHLVWSLERSATYLTDHNPLAESVGRQGVMVAVTAVVVRCQFGDNSPAVTALATADGSSRTTGAHTVLSLTPQEVVFSLPANDRAFRGMLAELLALLERPQDDLSVADVGRLRALQIPARLLLRFEADDVAPVGFARAVESLVHLVHVEPPKAWDEAASLDAKADSVITALHASNAITANRRVYLDGMLTPDEARVRNLPGEADERAVVIVSTLSSEKAGVKRAVRAGILELSHARRPVGKEEKSRIAVELALRAVRTEYPPQNIKSARGALQSAYQLPSLWACDLMPRKGLTAEELRDAALAELDAGEPGEACTLLAAQGGFWLAVHRVLREAHFFPGKEQRDGRSPQRVLEAVMGSRYGVLVLHRALVDGRDGQALARIDEQGRRENAVTGQSLHMTHEWLRGTVAPIDAPDAGGMSVPSMTELPTRLLLKRIASLRDAVAKLEDAHGELRGVKDAGGTVLVDREGINDPTVRDLRERMEALRTRLAVYGQRWIDRNEVEEGDEGLDDLDESDPGDEEAVGA